MMMSDPLWISSEANRPGLPSAAGYVARRFWTQLLRDQRLECFQRADLRELAASGGRLQLVLLGQPGTEQWPELPEGIIIASAAEFRRNNL
jgi:hypothetical protein